MTRSTDDVDQVLWQHGVHHLFGEITMESACEVSKFVFAHNLTKNPKIKHLQLIINSEGGSLTDAFAIVDVIRHSKIPIHTLGLGEISSAGLMIFMAGAPGHRLITTNTTIMSHQWSGQAEGKLHELLSAQQDQEQTAQRMIQHYVRCTGLSITEIEQHLLPAHDVYLTAQQAIDYHIADRIQS